jgi:hypothetical protein
MAFLLVGKVEGQPDQYLAIRGNGGRGWWTNDLNMANFFPTRKAVSEYLRYIRRSQDCHTGIDSITKLPLLDTREQPIKKIDLPYLIFQLLRLNITPGDSYKVEGVGNIFVCEVGITHTEEYLEVAGKYPLDETSSVEK